MNSKIVLLYLSLFSVSMMAQNIQEKLDSIFKKNELMGLSILIKNNNYDQSYSYGIQNLNKNLAVTKDTRFRIASISKAFTSLGLIKLYDQKKFQLDDDVSDYLGYKLRNPNFPNDKITFKMLLSHTSSVNDGAGYDTFLSDTYSKDTIPNIKLVVLEKEKYFTTDMWLNKKPGTYFTYCNLNFGLIGTLIEKISEQRFDIYMENEILKPLGIFGNYNISRIKEIENVAAIYRNEKGWKATKDDYSEKLPKQADLSKYEIGTNGVFYGPQGGLRVSAAEITIFLNFLKTNGKSKPNLISKATLQLMKKTHWKFNQTNGDNFNGLFNEWALGLHHANTTDKDKINSNPFFGHFIGHAGDAYGLISDAYFSEKENFSFVIITNGIFNGYKPGKTTAFYSFEEEIIDAICNDFISKKIKK